MKKEGGDDGRGEENLCSDDDGGGEAEVPSEAAASCRERGTLALRKGIMFKGHTAGKNSLLEACEEFARGLGHLLSVSEEGEELDGSNGELARVLYLNLAMANLLLEEWSPALSCCEKLLSDSRDIRASAEATLIGDSRSQAVSAGDDAADRAACKALFRRGLAKEAFGAPRP